MRISLLCALLAVPAFAADFTLETESGEVSRDASSSKATYVVTGTTVTLTTESSGRNFRPDDDKPSTPKIVTLSNTKEIEAALKAIRSTKTEKTPKLQDTRFRTGCLIEGKVKRCATVINEGTSPRLDAIGKLEQLLLTEIMK